MLAVFQSCYQFTKAISSKNGLFRIFTKNKKIAESGKRGGRLKWTISD